MKYLKRYKLFESNLPYREITSEEYDELTTGVNNPEYDHFPNDDFRLTKNYDETRFGKDNWQPFTQLELDKIKKFLPDADINREIKTDPSGFRIDSKEVGVIIVKLKDEWYYVLLNMSNQYEDDIYYQCDQLEGLLSLLKDIL